MPIIVGIIVLLFFTFIGFCLWAASELPLALREIAINSRKDRIRGPAGYALLKIMAILIKIWAAMTWITGVIFSYLLAAYLLDPSKFLSLFTAFSRGTR